MRSRALWGACGYLFFTSQNKSTVEIHRDVCSCHCRIICRDIQLLYTKHTSLLNFNSWFLLGGRKMNNCAHLVRCSYTQWKLHFQYCILHIFVKHLLHNFTVFPETQKLYLPAISHWSVHKTRRKKIGKLTFETTLVFLMKFSIISLCNCP